jgi:hypothetical protein
MKYLHSHKVNVSYGGAGQVYCGRDLLPWDYCGFKKEKKEEL